MRGISYVSAARPLCSCRSRHHREADASCNYYKVEENAEDRRERERERERKREVGTIETSIRSAVGRSFSTIFVNNDFVVNSIADIL